jgi:hypothetical protein
LRHTVFPYVVAFLPASVARGLEKRLLSPSAERATSTSALAQNVVSSSPCRRYCPVCARDDLARFGETYWHRTHQLPATLICEAHGAPLVQTDIRMTITTRRDELSLPPITTVRGQALAVDYSTAKKLAASTQRALRNPLEDAVDWCKQYRGMAESAGFVHPSGGLATASLAEQLRDFYGREVLSKLKCEVTGESHGAWPALLLRPGNKEPASAVRHVLLDAFLRSRRIAEDRQQALRKRNYPARDYAALDQRAAADMREALDAATEQSVRLTVHDLLERTGIRSAYVHNRTRFPLCRALVEDFKRSELSERQTGGREKWRRRIPSRFGTPSKRVAANEMPPEEQPAEG